MPDIRAYGKNARLIAGIETTWGTAGTPTTFRQLSVENFDPGLAIPKKEQLVIGNGPELQSGSTYTDGQELSPSFTAVIGVFDCLPIFRMAMGTPVTTGTTTLTHVFNSATDLPEGYTLEGGQTNISPAVYQLIAGFKVSNLAIDLSPEGVMKAKLSGRAKAYSESGTSIRSTPTTYTAGRYLNKNFKLKRAGTDLANVQSFSMNYSTGLETGRLLDGSGTIGFADAGIDRCTGRITLRFTADSQLYNDALAETASAFSLVGTTPINAGYSLTFDWARLLLEPISDPVEAAGGVMRSFNFVAERVSGGDLMKVTVINNTAAANI